MLQMFKSILHLFGYSLDARDAWKMIFPAAPSVAPFFLSSWPVYLQVLGFLGLFFIAVSLFARFNYRLPLPLMMGFSASHRAVHVNVVNDQSQVLAWSTHLRADFALRFQNAEPMDKFLERVEVYMMEKAWGGTWLAETETKRVSVIDIADQGKTVNLELGLTIKPGVSSLYYIHCELLEFIRNDQVFDIVIHVLGQKAERIRIVPDWRIIIQNEMRHGVFSKVVMLN